MFIFPNGVSRISGILRTSFSGYYWLLPHPPCFLQCQSLLFHTTSQSLTDSATKEQLDPFSLVADEVSLIAQRLRSLVVAEVPKLASAAEYVFKDGVEGKMTHSKVLLLMGSAMDFHVAESPPQGGGCALAIEHCKRQHSLAEITEMIHVANHIHDGIVDDANKRGGIGSLNFVMGNKLALLAGDFLLSRAFNALASLKNTEALLLLGTAVENLVTGETMQMTATVEQHCSMEYYMQKTYYKSASLLSNSCKTMALLSGQTAGVANLAYEYGKNLGLAYQLMDDILDFTGTPCSLEKGFLSNTPHGIITAPILFALEEFPQLRAVIDQGFDNPANIDTALEYLWKSRGIERTRKLAEKHSSLAAAAMDSLPDSNNEDVRNSRQALVILTQRIIRKE
ncbi:hypothetical protein SLEP1_g44994 [Rubroshorea leprosula]|uniref:Geranyl diphosphate synthase n=1 Tax=Rubroshorea leprosula TaxID=152421 RepID=A0AAV5LJA7_9ROSI|nr:hypothetical protein SLEP1_g44994 [Rubroshorea leprosula]